MLSVATEKLKYGKSPGRQNRLGSNAALFHVDVISSSTDIIAALDSLRNMFGPWKEDAECAMLRTS